MESYFQNYMRAIENPLPEMQTYFDAENRYLKSLISQDSSVLDVGCGNGRTMKFLAPFVRKITGIDYDPQMIEAAKKNLVGISNIELISNDFLAFAFPDRFDVTYASYNLLGSAEIKNKEQVLKKMLEVTKIGGRAIASIWSTEGISFAEKYYPSIGIQIKEIKNGDVITNYGTFKRFSKDELETLLKTTGKPHKIVGLCSIFYLIDIEN